MSAAYLGWFFGLAAACALIYYRTYASTAVAATPEFRRFQRNFLVVYLIMLMADWLQGPYVYALYQQYGFSKGDIGILFIVGFGSSLLFGTVVGSFADRFGRRLNCLLFVVLYVASCVTKHFNSFSILLVGRLLGGVSTSILFSAFETWMVHEHRAVSGARDGGGGGRWGFRDAIRPRRRGSGGHRGGVVIGGPR
jgi:MFS transporter, MFS domain-containing protein family, molybdate-anion transporter